MRFDPRFKRGGLHSAAIEHGYGILSEVETNALFVEGRWHKVAISRPVQLHTADIPLVGKRHVATVPAEVALSVADRFGLRVEPPQRDQPLPPRVDVWVDAPSRRVTVRVDGVDVTTDPLGYYHLNWAE